MTTVPFKIISSERSTFPQLMSAFMRYRHLLGLMIWRDLNVRYKQAAVGILWVVLQPIITALIFTLIFSYLIELPTDGIPYLVFAFAGTTLWRLFAQGVDRSSTSILREAGMITKVYFPRWILPLADIGSTLLDFMITLLVLLFLVFLFRLHPGWHLLLLLPAILLTVTLTAAVGISVALLCCKFRDLAFLISFILQILQFLSPVFYSLSLFRKDMLLLAYLNPMAGPLELFRFSITGLTHFSPLGFCLSLSMDLLLVMIAFRLIYELEDRLVDDII